MKFKKIEISAFRIYDDPSEATFDFTTETGDVANFVALYAPNGFGKTSFYDAVEWAITKSINRFYIRNKELQRLAHYQALENELPLIRNSKSDRETYVNIVFDDDQKLEAPFKKHGKQKYDLNFEKPVIHNFQRVILSQEWISAFLTESDGETRYKKFMENPELVEVSNYYSNLKHVQAAYFENTANLERDMSLLRVKISNDGDNNLLTNINNQIANLRDNLSVTSLKNITLSTTQEEIKELKDFVSGQSVFITREIEEQEKLLEQLGTVVSGTDRMISAATYYSFSSELPELLSRLRDVQSYLLKFEQLEKLENQVVGFNDQLRLDLETRGAINRVLLLFDSYEKIHRELSEKVEKRSQLEVDLSETNKLLEAQVKLELSIKNQIENVIKRIISLEESIGKIPQLRQQLDQITLKIKKLEEEIEGNKASFRELSSTVKDRKDLIQNLNTYLDEIRKNIFNEKNLSSADNIALLIEVKQLQIEVQRQNDLLAAIRRKIFEQREFNDAITNFIQTGLAMVNQGNLTNCPLCEHPHTSHTHLIEKISKNTSLDKVLQELLLEESSAITKLSDLEKSFLDKRLILEQYFVVQIESLQKDLKSLTRNQEQISKRLAEAQNDVRLQSAQQFEIQLEFKGTSLDEYAKSLSERLITEGDNRKHLNEEYLQSQSERERLQVIVQGVKQEIGRLNEEVSISSRDANYNGVIRWFELNRQVPPNRQVVEKELEEIDKKLIDLRREIELTKKTFDLTKSELIAFDRSNLKSEQKELESRTREHENATKYFTQFIQKTIDIDVNGRSMEELIHIIKEHEAASKARVDSKTKLLDELLILSRLCENIVEFLQSERLKTELRSKEDEYRFLVTTVKPRIENELLKTKDFLMTKIKEFFYIDLINDIYKKIDPHPDFREVRFNADFDSESPRLDIFVRNSKDTEALIPNLYFSTAQINILSLSIFLASALNSKDYKCIFVDDPIQSMDSINMLSTIDLLRSILVNGNRQIILSTHDKNFYDVLQKKMPSSKFKSRFLELESFGKVKPNYEN